MVRTWHFHCGGPGAQPLKGELRARKPSFFFFFFTFWLHLVACGILVPRPGFEPLHWELRVPTIRPPVAKREKHIYIYIFPKGNQSWIFIGRTDAEAETPLFWPPDVTHWKRPRWWERLKAGGEGDDRGWDGWMASPTQSTWVWVNSGRWWWTGRPGVLQSMGSRRVGHNCVTELNWIYIETENEWIIVPEATLRLLSC